MLSENSEELLEFISNWAWWLFDWVIKRWEIRPDFALFQILLIVIELGWILEMLNCYFIVPVFKLIYTLEKVRER